MAWAYAGMFSCHQMMYRENVGHLDVECWLRPCVEIVEFVNVELLLSIRHIDHWIQR